MQSGSRNVLSERPPRAARGRRAGKNLPPEGAAPAGGGPGGPATDGTRLAYDLSMSIRTPRSRHFGVTALIVAAAATLPLGWAVPAEAEAAEAGAAAAPAAPERQDLAQLESLASSTAVRELGAPTPDQHLVVGPLQPSLRLARCTGPVEAKIAAGLRIPGRLLVELRCEGASPWHLYVPVRVVGSANVVVAAHSLVAGNVLTIADLRVERHDLTELPPGYLDDAATAIGLSAARGISSGAILTNQVLLGAKAVQRGQTVTLIARLDGMSVRMAGRALSDGFVNQRVKVENLSSGKIVEGIARSQQIVEIIFQ